jgi:hypothetical protein
MKKPEVKQSDRRNQSKSEKCEGIPFGIPVYVNDFIPEQYVLMLEKKEG